MDKIIIAALCLAVSAGAAVTGIVLRKKKKLRRYKAVGITLPSGFTCTAHTGCCGTKENSLESIEKGIVSGANTVEFDLNFDKNNEPVLSHDEPKGGEVTLDEAFAILGKHKKITVNVDLKSLAALGKIAPLAEKHGMLERIFYTGVFEDWVETVRRDSPEVPYFLNLDVDSPGKHSKEYLDSLVKKVKDCGAIGINFNKKGESPELTQAFRAEGLLVSVWTANTELEIYEALACSPDNVTTKNPDVLAAIIKK